MPDENQIPGTLTDPVQAAIAALQAVAARDYSGGQSGPVTQPAQLGAANPELAAAAQAGAGMQPIVSEGNADLERPPSEVQLAGSEGNPEDFTIDQPAAQHAPLQKPAPTVFKRGDVAGTEKAEESSLKEAARAHFEVQKANLASEKDYALRLTEAYAQSASEAEKADQAFQTARMAAHRDADVESAQWLQQVTQKASEEPNPERWFESRSNLGKALWGLGLLASAFHTVLTPGAKNTVLEMVTQNIDKDVELQRQRLGRELDTMRLQGSMMEKRQARVLSDQMDDHAMRLSRIQALEKSWVARAKVPGTPQEALALAEMDDWFKQQKLGIIDRRVQQAHAEREADISRAHSAAMQKRQLDFETWKTLLEAGIKEQAAAAKGRADLIKGAAGTEAGLALVGAKGDLINNGTALFTRPEDRQGAQETAAAANKSYSAAREIADLLEKTPTADLLGGLNPRLNSLMIEGGYGEARFLNGKGRLTDSDFLFGLKAQLGFDPEGHLIDRGKLIAKKDEVVQMLRTRAANMKPNVDQELAKYNDKLVNPEGTLTWFPKSTTSPQAPEPPNAAQQEMEAGRRPRPASPKTPEEFAGYEAYEKTGRAFKGTALPEYDQAKLEAVEKEWTGLSSLDIAKKARLALDAIEETVKAHKPEPGLVAGIPKHVAAGEQPKEVPALPSGDIQTLEMGIKARAKAAIEAAREHEYALSERVRQINERVKGSKLDRADIAEMANSPEYNLGEATRLIDSLAEGHYIRRIEVKK